MHTQRRFPVLEQHFSWYQHSLTVSDVPAKGTPFIAGINIQTGEIEVGPVFEFMAYKVQIFIVYKLICLYSECLSKRVDNITDRRLTSDLILLKMNELFPHVDPDYFFRTAMVLMIRSHKHHAACFMQLQ